MQDIDALWRASYGDFRRFAEGLPEERLYRLLANLNVKYIISVRELASGPLEPIAHFPQYPSWLYALDNVVPRAYIVPKVIEEKNPFQILQRLTSEDFNPASAVLLEQPVRGARRKDFSAQTKIVEYTNRSVTVHTSLNDTGILVLADSFYPGWRAYVDGGEAEILRANLFFRAISLSPGEHRVEFHYRPRSFVIGLGISLATLCGLGVYGILVILRRRRTGSALKFGWNPL